MLVGTSLHAPTGCSSYVRLGMCGHELKHLAHAIFGVAQQLWAKAVSFSINMVTFVDQISHIG
jgi:hypothetical protein